MKFNSIETYEKYKNNKKILKEIQKANEKYQKRVEFYNNEKKKQIEKQQLLIESKMLKRLQRDESKINLSFNRSVCLKTSKKVPKKYEKKPKISTIKKQVYSQIQLLARLKEVDHTGYGRCISCWKRVYYKDADGGHYIPRSHMATAFDLNNIHLQCKYCNGQLHWNTVEYRKNLIKRYWEQRVSDLEAKKKEIKKYTIEDYTNLLLELKLEVEKEKSKLIS